MTIKTEAYQATKAKMGFLAHAYLFLLIYIKGIHKDQSVQKIYLIDLVKARNNVIEPENYIFKWEM